MSGLCLSLGLGQPCLSQLPVAQPITPMPLVQFIGLSGGTAEVSFDNNLMTVTITGNPDHNGSYAFDPALLSGGPVNLVAPTLIGAATVGAILTATQGIWVYDSGHGLPDIGYQWKLDGTNVAGATSNGWTIPSDASNKAISVAVSATQAVGGRTFTSAAQTIPWPVRFVSEPDGTISIETDSGFLSITISGGTPYDGTHAVDTALFASGPVNLVPPEIIHDGTPVSGEVLTFVHGLWVYDDAFGVPAITLEWLRNGAIISGETAQSYTLQAADEGSDVSLRETATQSVGARSSTSPAVSVPSSVVVVQDFSGATAFTSGSGFADLGYDPATKTRTFELQQGNLSIISFPVTLQNGKQYRLRGQMSGPAGFPVSPSPAFRVDDAINLNEAPYILDVSYSSAGAIIDQTFTYYGATGTYYTGIRINQYFGQADAIFQFSFVDMRLEEL